MVNLIIQGPIYEYTIQIAKYYQQLKWVDKIIISSWEGLEREIEFDTVYSKPLKNNGIGNRNAQIVSSLEGLKKASCEFSVKLRGDQLISLDSMSLLYKFMLDNSSKIVTLGFYKYFPFHPRDHSFWGKTEELIKLFDIPLDDVSFETANPIDSWPHSGFYSQHTRAETYIGSNYLAKKDDRVKNMIEHPKEYLYDFSPKWSEANYVSNELMPKFFVPSPKIDLQWPKYNLLSYNYEACSAHYGEFWS